MRVSASGADEDGSNTPRMAANVVAGREPAGAWPQRAVASPNGSPMQKVSITMSASSWGSGPDPSSGAGDSVADAPQALSSE